MKIPTVQLDFEASAYLAAMEILSGTPGYDGPTVADIQKDAAEAASKAVHESYRRFIGRAK